jgi:hypothetical protein
MRTGDFKLCPYFNPYFAHTLPLVNAIKTRQKRVFFSLEIKVLRKKMVKKR